MPTIPLQQKFHTIAANVATKERGSALVNSQKEIFTMQDIINTVPPGAAVNPTSTYIPFNNGGVFANSSLRVYPDTIYGTGIPFGIYNIGNPVFGGSPNLNIDDNNLLYSFGSAQINNFGGASAYAGLAINNGNAIIGCNMGNSNDGIFRASSNEGVILIGLNTTYSIGVNTALNTMRIGSGLTTTGTHTIIARWLKVNNESGTAYYIPLYS